MKTEIFENYEAFLARPDKSTNGVSPKFAELHPGYQEDNETNIGCWNCTDCTDCWGCTGWCENKPLGFKAPAIANIHQKVLEAVSRPGALNMADWHTCETTHCRAGWVVHLAGEAGYKLEKETTPAFAAMHIYKASSPIAVHFFEFFVDAETAMADMRRCAEEEAKLQQTDNY